MQRFVHALGLGNGRPLSSSFRGGLLRYSGLESCVSVLLQNIFALPAYTAAPSSHSSVSSVCSANGNSIPPPSVIPVAHDSVSISHCIMHNRLIIASANAVPDAAISTGLPAANVQQFFGGLHIHDSAAACIDSPTQVSSSINITDGVNFAIKNCSSSSCFITRWLTPSICTSLGTGNPRRSSGII